jgi:MFS family permease
VGYLLGQIGWQATFWTIGAVGGGIMFLLTAFYRNRPADLGLKPYGAADDDPPEAVRSSVVERIRVKVFNQHIRRTRAFWNLPLIHGLGCAGHGIVLIYSIPIAVEQGISLVAASVIISLISIFSVGSRLITPLVAERFGGKPIMAAALFIQGITVLVLFWAQDTWMFYLFATLFGIGFGGEMSAYLVVNRQYFGPGPIARCYGFQMMGAMMGHAIATGLAGLIIYVTGSFNPVLALSMAFSFVGVLVILTLESTSRALIPHWEQSLPPEARSLPVSSGAIAD